MRFQLISHVIVSALAGLLLALPARAQQAFPSQTVHLVVAFAPGGVADVIGRLVGSRLEEKWRNPVIAENRGGAGGNIAARLMARTEATGYKILVTTSAYAVNPTLHTNAGYDPAKDFIAVIVAATTPNVFVTAPNGAIKSLADLASAAKSRPVTYGSAGVGTTPHLSAERILKLGAGMNATHVPYTGAGPAVIAAMGGHVDIASVGLSAASELIKGGQARGLAVTSKTRLAALPDVPTVSEATGLSDADDATWVAFFVPAATPRAIVEKLNADINAVLATPAMRASLDTLGFTAIGGSQPDAAAFVTREVAKWGDVVKRLGLKVE